jgi:phosphoribosylglycinamide formyltransferase-1
MTAPTNIVILISGRGSNMQAIVDQALNGDLPVTVQAVISNRPDAPGLAFANKAGIPTKIVNHENYANKQEFEAALSACIDEYKADLIVLAGFMRVLSSEFVGKYSQKMINIHPSLLPEFPGLDTHARAIAAGVTEHGASVHFVTADVDAGPIIIQSTIAVKNGDTPASLASRVLIQEHLIYPLAIKWFAESRLEIKKNQVLLDGHIQPQQGLATGN